MLMAVLRSKQSWPRLGASSQSNQVDFYFQEIVLITLIKIIFLDADT